MNDYERYAPVKASQAAPCGCPGIGGHFAGCPVLADEADRAADELDRWADGYVEPEVQTGADEIIYADESEYV